MLNVVRTHQMLAHHPEQKPPASELVRVWWTLGGLVLPGYTHFMKTAISLPDDTFERANRRAHELGISRSEFFATAALRYLEELDRTSLTARIDQALEMVGGDVDVSDALASGRRRLAETAW